MSLQGRTLVIPSINRLLKPEALLTISISTSCQNEQRLLNYPHILCAHSLHVHSLRKVRMQKKKKKMKIIGPVPADSSSALPSATRSIFFQSCSAHPDSSLLHTLIFHCPFSPSLFFQRHYLVLHFLLHHPSPSSPPSLLTRSPFLSAFSLWKYIKPVFYRCGNVPAFHKRWMNILQTSSQ